MDLREYKEFMGYKVSINGDVFGKRKAHPLKPDLSKGYYRVTLSNGDTQKRVLVHRLIAQLFIFNPGNKPCVNHLDGNKLNNKADNLQWCTYSENERHSIDVLGKVNHNRKLSGEAVFDIRENCKKGVNVDLFILKYNVNRKTILNTLNKKFYV